MTDVLQSLGDDVSGAVLDKKYRVLSRIGEGSMGAVYQAAPVDDPSARVAVKVLHAEHLTDPEILRRFIDEGRACERLVHPNIVRVIDTLVAEDGRPFMVMELLSGVPLSAYTKSGGRVPLTQSAIILQGVLAGLAAAHAQGVIHRDLKPDNVFLARDEAGHYHATLLDFGIAKVMDVAGGMGQRTKTGALLGTPAYMSPEQIRDAKEVDGRSDLWSAGVMLYEMLTGRPAFPAPTEYARLSAVLNREPTPIAEVDRELAVIGPFVARALEKDRDKRFPSALDMARALSQLAATREGPAAKLSVLPEAASLLGAHLPPTTHAPATPAMPGAPATTSAPATTGPRTIQERGVKIIVHEPRPTAPGVPTATGSQPQVARQGDGAGASGTLPSKDLPMLDASRATHDASRATHDASRATPDTPRVGAPYWVLGLVAVLALALGFILGFAARGPR